MKREEGSEDELKILGSVLKVEKEGLVWLKVLEFYIFQEFESGNLMLWIFFFNEFEFGNLMKIMLNKMMKKNMNMMFINLKIYDFV